VMDRAAAAMLAARDELLAAGVTAP
jgi:hypothetical protein